jgi:hypothetical protein
MLSSRAAYGAWARVALTYAAIWIIAPAACLA